MMEDRYEFQTLRRATYALLIMICLSSLTGRILQATSRDGHTPFFSANDRSRWSTISSLVDEGTYAIDEVRKRPGWKSIDMVRHADRQGRLRYYSSKPPLYPTMLAGQYATIKWITGASLEQHPFAVARTMLIVTHVIPLALFLSLVAVWVERVGQTDWGRIYVVACACFGTFLTTFGITLNNHLPAAICVLIATLCVLRVWNDEQAPGWYWACAGLTASFAAANELPALSFLCIVGATLFWLSPRKTLLWFVPAAAVVGIAFFGTTYLAHDSLRPPYAHRNEGDNWYDYPGSYWYGNNRRGVDLGEPSRLKYGIHVLVGHHGIYSLTPIWLLSLAGLVAWIAGREPRQRWLAAMTLGLTLVCLVFYVGLRPERDRNYGGVACGFRWMFWFIPLWLLALVPAADFMSENRRRQVLALVLLAVSVVSAAFGAFNPWTHPWLYHLWLACGL